MVTIYIGYMGISHSHLYLAYKFSAFMIIKFRPHLPSIKAVSADMLITVLFERTRKCNHQKIILLFCSISVHRVQVGP